MRRFTALYTALNETNKTTDKIDALARYFADAEADDAAWALYFLTGRRMRLALPSKLLRAWAMQAAELPEWLFAECYDAVGDLSETIALVLPPPQSRDDRRLAAWVEEIQNLRGAELPDQQRIVTRAWRSLDETERFVWNKLLLGNFRVGASQQLVLRGLARAKGINVAHLAEGLMGDWKPSAQSFQALVSTSETETQGHLRPYPFCLAHALGGSIDELGDTDDWQVEWKWDGMRAQIVKRRGRMEVWSRGEDLVTNRFPELEGLRATLPDGTVLDGEILPWQGGRPLPFAALQKRITRKTLSKKILRELPVAFLAYDLLEIRGKDIRAQPLDRRRTQLEQLLEPLRGGLIPLSPLLTAKNWQAYAQLRAASREHGTEGLMLKRRSSSYAVGRKRGDWWKWKVEPLTVDAVLTAAQRGSGKRASLYTDYTFSVWDGPRLVPFAKAYSGLTEAEMVEVDAFVRKHMKEKFGPVRTVDPVLVFELGFEGIQRSTRHRSGLAVRFPRILRWRRDKRADQADSIETIRALLADASHGEGSSTTGSTSREGWLFER